MGVMEIGLKCAGKDGVEIFGIGRIDAAFHWRGTMEDDSDRFIISANGSARIGAPIRKNQAGMLSSPVAVGCRCKSCVDCWNAILDSLDALSTG